MESEVSKLENSLAEALRPEVQLKALELLKENDYNLQLISSFEKRKIAKGIIEALDSALISRSVEQVSTLAITKIMIRNEDRVEKERNDSSLSDSEKELLNKVHSVTSDIFDHMLTLAD